MSGGCVQPALLQERVDQGVRCLTCERRCVVGEGERGWCRTRENQDGTLHTLIYGAVSSLSCNPIEKKPLYHFYPGSVALTAGSWSCNFDCPWCQNWHISKSPPSDGRFIAPADFVQLAQERSCQGTSISFNEPTLSLEWSLEVFPLAHEAGLYNTFVTNGYMTEQALQLLLEAGLDGMNVDVKGDSAAVKRYCKADVEVVWRNCRVAARGGVWIEITTLVIPGVNDSEETLRRIAQRIVDEMGPDTPWHVSRYFPAYRFHRSATPVSTVERAREIGLEAGLHYVYLGNVPHHAAAHTVCPECGTILVRRDGPQPSDFALTPESTCPECGRKIAGRLRDSYENHMGI
ncbi:MAG: AmmeMemoRadiSam system radical SAM enzyme [Chloroflexota bacterium]|nr:AmmeMemoRadiSam system radical SAM enzyme [Chloroflexota bacterium]